MKFHPIFNKEFGIWWAGMAIVSVIKLYVFGLPKQNEGDGIVFWTLESLLWGLILGSLLYLIYRLFSGKWNNKAFIICISIGWFINLVFILD